MVILVYYCILIFNNIVHCIFCVPRIFKFGKLYWTIYPDVTLSFETLVRYIGVKIPELHERNIWFREKLRDLIVFSCVLSLLVYQHYSH